MEMWMAVCAIVCLAGHAHAGALTGNYGQDAKLLRGWVDSLTGQQMRPKSKPTARSWGFEFHNWGSTKVKRCPVNVVFVVDGSDSVSLNGFQKAKDYLKREIRSVTSSFAGTDVGVLFFSDGIYREMPLQTRNSAQLQQLYNDIDNLQQPRDKTELTTALRRSRQLLEQYKKEGNVIVVISDGCPYNLHATVNEALLSWLEGIFIISLGIEEPQISLQKKISSRIQDGNTSIDWSDILMCPGVILPGIGATSNCRDFMFVVDGSDSLCHHQDIVKAYLKSAIHRYENVSNAIGVTIFGTEIGSQAAPNTNKMVVKAEINGLDFPLSGTRTTSGVVEAQRLLDQAGRSNSKALILVTDGPPLSLNNAINAVSSARSAGYEIVVIGVGDDISSSDLVSLAGNNQDNVFQIDTYLDLYSVDFSSLLCGGRILCDNTIANCVNGNAGFDSNGVCRCLCNQGYTGPTCGVPNPPSCTNADIGCINGNANLDSSNVCRCFCNAGYSGARCENRVCTNALIGCINGVAQADSLGNCRCICSADWTGTRCEARVLVCTNALIGCLNGNAQDDGLGCRCVCNPGYSGSRCETRVCTSADINCQNGGSAVPNSFGRCVCSCRTGYIGTNCQTRDCSTQLLCENSGTAIEQFGSCTCRCPVGYSGPTCANVDCTRQISCRNGGVAVNQFGTCRCQCASGYTGSNCENQDCSSLICQNGGTAVSQSGSCRCQCPFGYSGTNCQIRDCSSVITCANRGSAVQNAFSGNCECRCTSQFTGPTCQTPRSSFPNLTTQAPIRPPGQTCTSLICNDSGTDFRDVNNCKCVCKAGYSGDSCQPDNNGCPFADCDDSGTMLITSTCQCQCRPGYSGPRCEPVDPCATFTCLNNGRVSQQNGQCVCVCPSDYAGSRCETRFCDGRQFCMNGGTPQRVPQPSNGVCPCTCLPGFSGNQCETGPRCSLNCRFGALVEATATSPCSCQCNTGYTGQLCDTCASNPCRNGGFPSPNAQCNCACPVAFNGRFCETPVCDANSPLCQNGGTQVLSGGRCVCQCANGFSGEFCGARIIIPCDQTACQNGGTNERFGSTCRCQCPVGSSGINCEITQPVCNPNACRNGGTNVRFGNRCICQCPVGSSGLNCEIITPECSRTYCQNGRAVSSNGNCVCVCDTGYTGLTCSDKIGTPCNLNCFNGGTVRTTSCTCQCVFGFTGAQCEDITDLTTRTCDNSEELCGPGGEATRDCNGRCVCTRCPRFMGGPRCDIELRANLCDDCKYQNGVGYTGVQQRCDLFVRCQESVSGPPVPEIFECAPGTLFDQSTLTCNHPDQVFCKDDFCLGKASNSTYSHIRECQPYWRCSNGKTVQSMCCPPGQGYDRGQRRCLPDPNCPETCRRDATSRPPCPGEKRCHLIHDPTNPKVFSQMVGDVKKTFSCGPGTVFDLDNCVCVHDTRPTTRVGSCDSADWPIEFNDKINSSFVFENVDLVTRSGADGKAGNFTGRSRVFINPFAKSGFHNPVFVSRVRIQTSLLQPGQEYAVVSNGDCNVTASMAITVRPSSSTSGQAFFKVVAEGNDQESAVDLQYTTDSNGWVTLELRYVLSGEGSYDLTGSAKGAGAVTRTSTVTLGGKIATRECPVQIGQGYLYQSFVGFVDWARFWILCDPGEMS